jgi:hypothetical protein
MDLRDYLKQTIDLYPPGSSVLIPVDTIKQWLSASSISIVNGDYEIEDVAALEKRSPITIRNWCRQGAIPGAYKQGKTWKIPQPSYNAFKEAARPPVVTTKRTALGSWRTKGGTQRLRNGA